MPTAQSKTISVSIQRSLQEVHDFMARPASFARWASGLGRPLENDGTLWRFHGETGPVSVRFTEPNAYGSEIYVPLRAIANGTATEVQLTLFRVPGMDNEKFEADVHWVLRDLNKLKELLEAT